MTVYESDCLVIGSGLAGSAYALQVASLGFSVELLSAGDRLASNTDRAQGGIIYDVSEPDALARDIFEASEHTSNPEAVAWLVREGPAAVREMLIERLGVPFDRAGNGALDLTREGGHGARRIIHAKDETGHVILAAAAAAVDAEKRITRRQGRVAVDLLTLSHNSDDAADKYRPLSCYGAYVLDTATGQIEAFVASKTILATGGLGAIYLHTTNDPGSVGHGVAMAYRVGARVTDLEYVQFHPTVFAAGNAPRFLVTEALRGEGGVLVNGRGERFVDAVDPRGSLAPRDVVSRAVKGELAASGAPCVFLDLSALKPDFIRERFPRVAERCAAFGLDITAAPIPVVPAAHYSCGGVHTDLRGRTNILHLNAIGETACTGLHGANRLASTSLLECLVGAKFAAHSDAEDLRSGGFRRPSPRPWEGADRLADPVLISQDLQLIRSTMWNYAGIIRSADRLSRARRILLELRDEIQTFYRGCRLTRELIELRSAAQTALLVVHAAALNPRSKGCHFLGSDE